MASRQQRVTDHFNAYAVGDAWGDLYNPRNPLSHSFLARLRKTLELLGDLEGRRLLDMGCGSGALLAALPDVRLEYQGIDIAPKMIAAAQRHIDERRLGERFKVRVGSVETTPFPSAHFDAVVGMGLLEYFDRPEIVIREAMRVAKPAGLLVFTIPRRNSVDDVMVRATAPVRSVARTILRKAPEVRHDMYTDNEFRDLFHKFGCIVVGERYYNRLLLPYPISRFAPRIAFGVARLVENLPGLDRFATGYILACTK